MISNVTVFIILLSGKGLTSLSINFVVKKSKMELSFPECLFF